MNELANLFFIPLYTDPYISCENLGFRLSQCVRVGLGNKHCIDQHRLASVWATHIDNICYPQPSRRTGQRYPVQCYALQWNSTQAVRMAPGTALPPPPPPIPCTTHADSVKSIPGTDLMPGINSSVNTNSTTDSNKLIFLAPERKELPSMHSLKCLVESLKVTKNSYSSFRPLKQALAKNIGEPIHRTT